MRKIKHLKPNYINIKFNGHKATGAVLMQILM